MSDDRAGATVLMGWELGGGLSHVQTLRRLGRALTADGARPVLALKDVFEPTNLLAGDGLAVVRAPHFEPRPWTNPQPFLATRFSDILSLWGYSSLEDLWPRVRAWERLLDFTRPALVVCEFAPTLSLAAAGRCPVVEVGSGFNLPPLDGPTFPCLLDGEPQVPGEDCVREVVCEVQRRRGLPVPATLPAAFAHAERFLTVLPEMDPYLSVRPSGHLGPMESLPPPSPPPRPSYFAYLNGDNPGVDAVLVGLAGTGVPGSAFVRGATPERRDHLRRQGVTVEDNPLPLEEVLRRTLVMIHHGGVKTSQMALAAGRPQIVFPQHLEQILNACLLDRLGVVVCPSGRVGAAEAATALRRVVSTPTHLDRAQRLAADLAARGPWDALPTVLQRCRALLGGQGVSTDTR